MNASGTLRELHLLNSTRLVIEGERGFHVHCPINLQHRTDLLGRLVRAKAEPVGGWNVRVTRYKLLDDPPSEWIDVD